MDDSADQLAPPQVDKTYQILEAFVAPVAHESDAVTKDPRALVMAQSVYAAFGNYGAAGGLTRNQIASACANSVPREVFESRFDLLVSMGFLYRYADKAHQMTTPSIRMASPDCSSSEGRPRPEASRRSCCF